MSRRAITPAASRLLLWTTLTLVANPRLQAKEFVVNSLLDLDDLSPGNGVCSTEPAPVFPRVCTLRAAVREANAFDDGGPDLITLPAGTFLLSLAGVGEDDAARGDLNVTHPLVIRGEGADETIVDGGGLDRVFEVHGTELTLKMLTVTGGAPPGPFLGGGVYANDSSLLRLEKSRLTANRADRGAAVFAYRSALELIDSDISANSVTADQVEAAAVYLNGVGDPAFLEVLGSTVHGTECLIAGGGGCTAGGMGLFALGCGFLPLGTTGVVMRNSTVSGNAGDGLFVYGCNGTIENSTIVENRLGVFMRGFVSETVVARNTIIAKNRVRDCDVDPIFWDADGGSNLSSDATCYLAEHLGDLPGADPQLHPLGHHLPPPYIAPAHYPLWGSIVVDQGQNLGSISYDEHGTERPQDGDQNGIESYDLGAIEALACIAVPNLVVDESIAATMSSIVEQACRSITTSGPVEVSTAPGLEVRFLARDFVVLGEGFSVAADSTFSVFIMPYAGALP